MRPILIAFLVFAAQCDWSLAQSDPRTGREILETCETGPPFLCELAVGSVTAQYTRSLGGREERACLPTFFDNDGFAPIVAAFLRHDAALLDASADDAVVAVLDHYGLAGAACTADRTESQFAVIDRCVWGRSPRCEDLLRETITGLQTSGEPICVPATTGLDALGDLVRDEVRNNFVERGRSAEQIVLAVAAQQGWSGDACPPARPAGQDPQDFGTVERFMAQCQLPHSPDCRPYVAGLVAHLTAGGATLCVPDGVPRDALHDYLAHTVASAAHPPGMPAEDAVVETLRAIQWAGTACSGDRLGIGRTFILRCGGTVPLACDSYMGQVLRAVDEQGIRTCIPAYVTAEQVRIMVEDFLHRNAAYLDAPVTDAFVRSAEVFGPC